MWDLKTEVAVWRLRYQISLELLKGNDSLFGRRNLHHAGRGYDLCPDLSPDDEAILRHESHCFHAEICGYVLSGRCVPVDFKYGRRYFKLPPVSGWNQ